ncbi:MAG: FMN-dependent NADH-azoreductase [Myxococcales bacterium]|nr:MAG: FMN-dependent NADH-azoreductase [Myxococcales bacterium]
MKLLHIDSSILAGNSASRTLTAAIVARLRSEQPGLEVTYRDLSVEPPAHLTGDALPAEPPPVGTGHPALEEFVAADIVVIGAPMYNFSIPSQLKAWLDRILVARRTFAYGPDGVQGLAGGKRAILAISRGGLYGAGSPTQGLEHAESYLRACLGFIGITSPEVIIAEGLVLGPAQREQAVASALRAIEALPAA